MATVVVVGGVNVDLTVHARTRPRGGETVVGDGPVTSSGGKGANQAVAAAYAGASVRLCAAVGDDPAGARELAHLRAAGIDVSGVRTVTDTSTGTAFILLTPDGENSIVVGTGANAALSPDDVAAALAPSPDPDLDREVSVVLAQTEPGIPAIDAAAKHAQRCGARLVVNAAPVAGLGLETLRHADPLVVNEHEATDLLREHGIEVTGPAEGLARTLREHVGCGSVVVSLGASGACVVDADREELVASPTVPAVDTTGAGDVLVGVLAARLARGDSLVSATRQACDLAARAVTTEGARGYLDGPRGSSGVSTSSSSTQ